MRKVILILVVISVIVSGNILNNIKNLIIKNILTRLTGKKVDYINLNDVSSKEDLINDLMNDIAVLRQEIVLLRSGINSNKIVINTLKKEKEIIRRNNELEINSLKQKFSTEVDASNKNLIKELENDKLNALKELKEKFEQEKNVLIANLKSQHQKEVSVIKDELINLQKSYNGTKLSVDELKEKLKDQKIEYLKHIETLKDRLKTTSKTTATNNVFISNYNIFLSFFNFFLFF
jgi:chromosome segregation ATPase